MDRDNDKDLNIDFEEDATISRVGPWKDKHEFETVYHWIFSSEDNLLLKTKAYDRLSIWKLRRLGLTPASILSTLAILEVEVKDNEQSQFSSNDLRVMYSSAFTKFVNYMSSITRSRMLNTMYSTAKELGIESFLIDLRHLCAHGQVMPALDICRRTSIYCMKWLKAFYWDRELRIIRDATVKNVHLRSSLQLENAVREMLVLYDAATEAIAVGCKTVDDAFEQNILNEKCESALKEYSDRNYTKKLTFIVTKTINNLATLSNSNGRDRGNANIYFDILMECRYFIQRSASYSGVNKSDQISKFVGLHQNFFRLLAISDFINAFFSRFITICEDDLENDERRKAASFWAMHIVDGFITFKEFKNVYKLKKEKNSKFDMDTAPVNTDIMSDDIKRIYKSLGIDYKGTLIFGDTVRRPWSLHFDRNFLIERIENINQYTIDIIKKCTLVSGPMLTPNHIKHFNNLIKIYTEQYKGNQNNGKVPILNDDVVYTLEDHIMKPNGSPKATAEHRTESSTWSEASDSIEWRTLPLGTFL